MKSVRGWIQQHPSNRPHLLAGQAFPRWHSHGLIFGFALLFRESSPSWAAERSTDSTWSQRLILGVNGPIPVIVVDQFGYPTKATKIAVIQNPQVGYGGMAPGDNYAVVDRATGAIVKRGTPVAWDSGATDPVSSDKAWWFDFSDLTAPGTYVILMQNEDGSLLCVQGLDQASPPSAATGPSYYGPATTAASLMGAAAFAYASKIYSARTGETLRRYGYDLATRAKQAWDWAIANPRLARTCCGSAGNGRAGTFVCEISGGSLSLRIDRRRNLQELYRIELRLNCSKRGPSAVEWGEARNADVLYTLIEHFLAGEISNLNEIHCECDWECRSAPYGN